MELWDQPVPMGPAARGMIQRLLASHLSLAQRGLDEAVRATAARVYRDLDRLPWASSFLGWFNHC